LAVAAATLVGNRIVAVALGVWLRMPVIWMLSMLIFLDIVQVPFFYWLYENSHIVLSRLPPRFAKWFGKDGQAMPMSRWAASLGGVGVMLLAALPTLGGGMWSAVFLAYGLHLDRKVSYAWLISGSVVSYFTLYWITDVIVTAIRYFGPH
jgi:hypothetical protein